MTSFTSSYEDLTSFKDFTRSSTAIVGTTCKLYPTKYICTYKKILSFIRGGCHNSSTKILETPANYLVPWSDNTWILHYPWMLLVPVESMLRQQQLDLSSAVEKEALDLYMFPQILHCSQIWHIFFLACLGGTCHGIFSKNKATDHLAYPLVRLLINCL